MGMIKMVLWLSTLVLFKTWVQKTDVVITWNNSENLLEFFYKEISKL